MSNTNLFGPKELTLTRWYIFGKHPQSEICTKAQSKIIDSREKYKIMKELTMWVLEEKNYFSRGSKTYLYQEIVLLLTCIIGTEHN